MSTNISIIDFHSHINSVQGDWTSDANLVKSCKEIFGVGPIQPMKTFLAAMDEARVSHSVILPLDCTSRFSSKMFSNGLIAKICSGEERLIGFASVDPNVPSSVDELEHAVKDLGLRGLNLDPGTQGFSLLDRNVLFPVLLKAQELRIPVIFECGINWSPVAKSSPGKPIHLEEVAVEFPDLKFVISHCGFPWIEDAIMLAIRYPGAYLDTSIIYSCSPKEALNFVFRNLIGMDVVRRSLRNKIVYATDTPRIRPKRMTQALDSLELDSELLDLISFRNAETLLGGEL